MVIFLSSEFGFFVVRSISNGLLLVFSLLIVSAGVVAVDDDELFKSEGEVDRNNDGVVVVASSGNTDNVSAKKNN